MRVAVNPEPGMVFPVTLEHAEIWNEGETVSWQGSVDTALPGLFRLSMTGEAVEGYLASGEGRVFQFQGRPGEMTITEVDRAQVDMRCPIPDEPAKAGEEVRAATIPEATKELPGPASVIDVLVVYTAAARTAAGGDAGILNQIREAVSYTNQAYANTGLAMRIALAGTAEVSYTETGNCSTTLSAVTNGADGQMDNVEALRTQYGADLVSLWTLTGDCGGIGWVMRTNTTASARNGYSVTVTQSPAFWRNISFAHELGHNLGSMHDRANSSGQGLFAYSYGYQSTSAQPFFRDIMAYQCAGADCPTVQYFSSPDVVVNGRPIGVAAGAPNSADAAQTFTLSAPTVEAYRPRASGTNLTASPTFVTALAGGGVYGVAVTTAAAWTATTTANWIGNITPAGGTGNGQVSFTVAANQSGAVRRGSLQIGPVTVVVEQAVGIACTSTPIAIGANLNGTLGAGSCTSPIRGNTPAQRYTFTGNAGQQVAIGLSSTAFDTHLYLISPTGTVAAENGDSNGTNSRIPVTAGWVTLATSGTYTIEATSFTAGAAGAFTLSLTAPGCSYSLTPSVLNETAQQTLRNVTVTTSAGCGWTATPNSAWISVASGSAGSGTGTVSLQIAANAGGAARTGTVTIGGQALTVNQTGPSGCASPAMGLNTPTAGAVTAGSTCKALFRGTNYNAARYSFAGTAGQQVRFVLESPTLDTYLYLVGPGGTIVAEDDDSAGNLNSAIPSLTGYVTLPETGTYTVEGTTFDAGEAGTFWVVALPAGGGDTARLTTGVASTTTLPAVGTATYFNLKSSTWAIPVPEGATRLEVQLTTTPASADPDLFVNYGAIAAVSQTGFVQADHSSESFSGTETVVVTPSSNPPLRAGLYYVNLSLFSLNQAATVTVRATVTTPGGATVTVAPTATEVGAAAGTGAIGVTPNVAGGAWSTSSSAAWVTVGPANGTGEATATYSYQANSGAARTATLTIGGASFVISQAAAATPVVTQTPFTGTGSSKVFSVHFRAPGGLASLGVVNLLINNALNGDAACYVAYSRPLRVLYLVNDGGPASGLSPGLTLGGSGTLANTQCTIFGTGSSAVETGGDTLQLNLNIGFGSGFAGNRLVYAAARGVDESLNSGWAVVGVHEVPGAAGTYPRSYLAAPGSGSTAATLMTFTYEDATSANNLQTVWALVNSAVDGRQACYVAYYVPDNRLYLVPDNGDGSLAVSVPLAGSNFMQNSRCLVSAAGASVVKAGNRLTLTLNITFWPAFGGYRGIWTAAQTLGGAQTSAWKASGIWAVPGQ